MPSMKIIYLYPFIIILCEVGKTVRWEDGQASDLFLSWVGTGGSCLRRESWGQFPIGLSYMGAYRSR